MSAQRIIPLMVGIRQVCFNAVDYHSFFFADSHISLLVLKEGDVMKVDFGVHVKGRIVDSAFTLSFDHTYDKLLEAVRAATDTGVRVCYMTLSWSSRFNSAISYRKPVSMSELANSQATSKKRWSHMR